MTVRVAAVGDMHVGADSHRDLRTRFATIGDHADLFLLTGDYTRWGAADEAAALASALEGLALPMFGVLGNHEFHSNENKEIVDILEEAGLKILEGETAVVDVNGVSIGIAGAKGFGGGFKGASGADFGEPEMKAFIRHTQEIADGFHQALCSLRTDLRIALLHYAPVRDTLVGENPELYAWLGSHMLGHAIDSAGADIVLHGHAHAGTFEGQTPGGVPVYNVAEDVLGDPYHVFTLGS